MEKRIAVMGAGAIGASIGAYLTEAGQDVMLIDQCSNVHITTDLPPPWSKLANISFDLQENGQMHNYQITATLRNQATHLLDQTGHIVSGDDD